MLKVRKANERGHADHGWLNTYHTFSFAGYYDPQQMGFRSLRVMNEDRVAPGKGFGTHEHRDMEIVSYVLSGALEHKDSMGNGEVLKPGEFQRITAGTGITHSEFNPSADEPTHFYQIWLLPDRKGNEPSYEQKTFDPAGRENQLQLVASPDGSKDSLLVHQDARIFVANLEQGKQISYSLDDDRHVWLQLLRGSAEINGVQLEASDGVAISNESLFDVKATKNAELMLFDLA